MVAVAEKSFVRRKGVAKPIPTKIPEYLIYEWLNGQPVYYQGYKNVIAGELKFEEIMAYGSLQWLLINLLKDYFQPIFGKNHWVWSGEGGLHVEHKSNLSLDFIILRKTDFSTKEAQNRYLTKPPRLVIEVDTKADFESLPLTPGSYYLTKTQTLLDFGVKEVVWIYTEPKMVFVARPGQAWLTVNWTDEIEIMGHRFTLQNLIDSFEQENEQE